MTTVEDLFAYAVLSCFVAVVLFVIWIVKKVLKMITGIEYGGQMNVGGGEFGGVVFNPSVPGQHTYELEVLIDVDWFWEEGGLSSRQRCQITEPDGTLIDDKLGPAATQLFAMVAEELGCEPVMVSVTDAGLDIPMGMVRVKWDVKDDMNANLEGRRLCQVISDATFGRGVRGRRGYVRSMFEAV